MTVYEYGKSRLFDQVGMDSPACGMDPQGICDGGSGFSMNVYDMAKFGQLCLNGGVWAGEQIVPAELRAPVPRLPLWGAAEAVCLPVSWLPLLGPAEAVCLLVSWLPLWGSCRRSRRKGDPAGVSSAPGAGYFLAVPGGGFWHWPRRGRFRAPGRG